MNTAGARLQLHSGGGRGGCMAYLEERREKDNHVSVTVFIIDTPGGGKLLHYGWRYMDAAVCRSSCTF